MQKQTKTKEQLTNELEKMRQRTAELEKVEAEHRRMEEALRQSEGKYHTIFSESRDGIVLVDAETGAISDCNPEFERQTGRKIKQLKKMHIWEIRPSEKVEAAKRKFFEVKSKGAGEARDLEFRRPDGEIVPIEFKSQAVEILGRRYLQSITRDITERKRAEEELRASEEKLRVTFESISDAVAVIDLEGHFSQVNEAAARMTGFTKEELVGQNVLETMIAKKDRDKIVMDMAQTLGEGDALGVRSYTLITKDGREFESEFSTAVLRDSSGNITNFVGVARDVTERKQAEKERERLLAELEDKSKEMKQLLFIASHDLRSPLVNIQGFTREIKQSLQQVRSVLEEEDIPSSVKEKLAAPIEEGIADSLSYILASSAKIDTLLTGLLKLSRLGQVAITIEKLNMMELMAEVADSFEFQTKEAGVKLEVGKLPPCQGDRAQINQVFSNLIGNALKYPDPERPGIIRVSGGKKDSKAIYTVEDNGIGIAPEHQETVFEIFQRVDPTASSGEGLGLTIVRRILDRHGGKVWLESEPGRGSRFHVSLPIGD